MSKIAKCIGTKHIFYDKEILILTINFNDNYVKNKNLIIHKPIFKDCQGNKLNIESEIFEKIDDLAIPPHKPFSIEYKIDSPLQNEAIITFGIKLVNDNKFEKLIYIFRNNRWIEKES